MSSAGKRATVTHLLDRGARRRITAAGLTALAGAALAAPLTFTTRAGASTDEPTSTTTELSIPDSTTTTDTVATTTTVMPIAPPIAPAVPTTTATEIVTTTTPPATVVGQGVVQLGGDQTPVTLAASVRAAATQLPRTGAAPTLPTLTGIALLIAGALASTTKRRRQMGAPKLKSRERS